MAGKWFIDRDILGSRLVKNCNKINCDAIIDMSIHGKICGIPPLDDYCIYSAREVTFRHKIFYHSNSDLRENNYGYRSCRLYYHSYSEGAELYCESRPNFFDRREYKFMAIDFKSLPKIMQKILESNHCNFV